MGGDDDECTGCAFGSDVCMECMETVKAERDAAQADADRFRTAVARYVRAQRAIRRCYTGSHGRAVCMLLAQILPPNVLNYERFLAPLLKESGP